MRVPALVLTGIACVIGVAAIKAADATSEAGPFLITVTTSPNPYAIRGNTSVANSAGILGYGTGTKDVALEGYATQPGSVGLEGFAQSTSGTASNGVFGYSAHGTGIYGVTAGSGYAAIFGDATATNGAYGVQGMGSSAGVMGTSIQSGVDGVTTASTSTGAGFAGVFGADSSSSGLNYGVAGSSDNGWGVFGLSTYSNGVVGETTAGTLGSIAGVNGDDESSGGTGVAVEGNTTNGYAVYGRSNNYYGVVGRTEYAGTSSTNPYGGAAGVVGEDAVSDSSSTGRNAGVYGTTALGIGVLGSETGDGPGGYVSGVLGTSSGRFGMGVSGVATNGGFGLDGYTTDANSVALLLQTNGGPLIEAQNPDYTDVMSLDTSGNMILAGKLTQNGTPLSVVRDTQGRGRIAYLPQETEATIEDFGESRTSGGRASVPLDPNFASVLAPGSSYLVFLTPLGAGSLYIADRSPQGFVVRSVSGADVGFEYRIVAHPRASEQQSRLAFYRDPTPSTHHPMRRPAGRALAARTRLINEVSTSSPLPKPHLRAIARPKTPPMPPIIRP